MTTSQCGEIFITPPTCIRKEGSSSYNEQHNFFLGTEINLKSNKNLLLNKLGNETTEMNNLKQREI